MVLELKLSLTMTQLRQYLAFIINYIVYRLVSRMAYFKMENGRSNRYTINEPKAIDGGKTHIVFL